MGRNKRSNSATLVKNNESFADAFKIAEGFNNYFSSEDENLAQDVEEIDPSYELFLFILSSFNNFTWNIYLISNLTKISPGHDEISAEVVDTCKDEIDVFLKYIINILFSDVSFPIHLKIARITPIFKKCDTVNLSNYRAISVLF